MYIAYFCLYLYLHYMLTKGLACNIVNYSILVEHFEDYNMTLAGLAATSRRIWNSGALLLERNTP